ncbi:MAG: DNA-directed RNA polymerase subunit omega [Lachnospiraceae bacterium]|nr:DNA-directed RNA polymerase subunit omega [Lachnospiraceae bacterium]
MLHPSYTDLMKLVNSEVESGEAPVVNSRYSIVLATSKRARQLIDGVEPMSKSDCPKPLSVAIDELYSSKIRILSEEEAAEADARRAAKKRENEEMGNETFSFEEAAE